MLSHQQEKSNVQSTSQEQLFDYFTPVEVAKELDILFNVHIQSEYWINTPPDTKGNQSLMIRLLRNHFLKI